MNKVISLMDRETNLNNKLETILTKQYDKGLCGVGYTYSNGLENKRWMLETNEQMNEVIEKEFNIDNCDYLDIVVDSECGVCLRIYDREYKSVNTLDKVRVNKVIKLVSQLN